MTTTAQGNDRAARAGATIPGLQKGAQHEKGENAYSREFSEDAYRLAAEPKELHIVPGAGHVDLYDRVTLIPWDSLASFFRKHLKQGEVRNVWSR